MVMCYKQRLSNIWSWIREKLSSTEAELKNSVAYKKACSLCKIAKSVTSSP